jgi:hypothetical protein
MPNVPLNDFGSAIVNGSGAAVVSLGPRIGQRWVVTAAAVSTSTAVAVPQANIYIGNAAEPANLVDGTFTGNLDSTSKTAGFIITSGQNVIAVWSGADPGAVATLSIIGFMAYGQDS